MKYEKNNLNRKLLIAGMILLAAAGGGQLAARNLKSFGSWYALRVYSILVSVVGRIWGILPVSAAELGLYGLAIGAVSRQKCYLHMSLRDDFRPCRREIGEIMGVKPALVSTWLARGREKLKMKLGGEQNGTLPQTAE